MTMRASLIIEARDRTSAVFGRIAAKARAIAPALRPVATQANAAERAISRMGWNGMRDMARMERGAFRLGQGIGSLTRAAAGWAVTAGAAGAAASGGFFAQVVRVSSQFEQFAIILENTEGSAEAARRSMAWVQDFAKSTPFELDQVMQAYVALRSYGIDPTNGSLRVLGDTAAGMGKPVMQAVEMMADAMTGEFERLKEFGVRARVEGDRVTFTYRQNGRELTRTARNSSAEIERALTGILGDRFGGMMERQSKTLAGMWSNIKDQASAFMLRIGQAGMFDRLKARTEAFLNRIAGAEGSPRMEQWAQRMSDNMGVLVDRAFDFVENTDWMAVANGIAAITGALITVVGWIGKAASAWAAWRRDVDRRQLEGIVNNSWVSAEERQQARRTLDRMNREDDAAAGRRPTYPGNEYPIGMRVPRGAAGQRGGANQQPIGAFAPWNRQRQQTQPGALLRRPGGASASPWMSGRGPVRSGVTRPQPVRVGGRMDLRVSMSPQLEGRLTRLESANRDVPIRASRGTVSTS